MGAGPKLKRLWPRPSNGWTKQVGVASYFAQNCNQPWQGQNMQMEFSYTQNIPEWAFKRAARHLLQRNIKDQKIQAVFNPITDLYRRSDPVTCTV